VALIGVVCALAAGCTTVTKGSATGPGQASGSGQPPGSGQPSPTGNLSELSARIAHSSAQIKSVQGSLKIEAGPLSTDSTFRGLLGGGAVTAMDQQVNTTFQGTQTKVHLIYVNQKIYVDRGQNGKPWIVATPQSSDPVAAQLAQTLPASLTQYGGRYYVLMMSAGHDLSVVGPDTVGGVACTRYHLVVDPKAFVTKLPASQRGQMQAAIDAGVDSVPLDMWVDGQSRPVKIVVALSVQGQSATSEYQQNHFDEPVTITPPPADQIGTG
jgi:hypothetical protein